MRPGDVAAALEAAAERAQRLAGQVADLYELAYGRTVGERIRSGTPEGYAHTTTGDAHAKRAWVALEDAVDDLDDLARLEVAVERIFGAGHASGRPGVPIRDDELAAAIAAQARRRERGEYVPTRRVPQPGPVRR